MSTIVVKRAERPLGGSVPVPCDAPIARRWLLLASLSSGTCELSGIGLQTLTRELAGGLSALGAPIAAGERRLGVTGGGLQGLHAPAKPIDCAGCFDSAALLLGLLAGQPFPATVRCAAALDTPLLTELVALLAARGARLEPPLRDGPFVVVRSAGLSPGERLEPIEWVHAGSLALKSALLVSGLYARAPTAVQEDLLSPDHTERAFAAANLPLHTLGPALELHPPADALAIRAFSGAVPGDFAAAQLLLAAAAVVSGSRITLRDVGLNVSRTGGLDLIRQLGGNVGLTPHGARSNEPVGDVSLSAAPLTGRAVGGEAWARLGFELVLPLVLAGAARGVTTLTEASLAEPGARRRLVDVASRFGLRVVEDREIMRIDRVSASALTPSSIASQGDSGVVILATLLGLLASGETAIADADCVAGRFPRFVGTLRALGAPVEVRS